jgi:radical SAM protein with 4Fe4S-binding SPASM domain
MAPARVSYGKAATNKERVKLDINKIKILGKKINELNRQYAGKINFSVSPNMFDYPTNPELIKSIEVGCEAGRDIIYISSNGDIFPCYTLAFPEFKGGNILVDDISNVWDNSKVFKNFRKLKIANLKKCYKCTMIDKCSGGCRGSAYAEFRDIKAPDPVYCSFFLDKEYIESID